MVNIGYSIYLEKQGTKIVYSIPVNRISCRSIGLSLHMVVLHVVVELSYVVDKMAVRNPSPREGGVSLSPAAAAVESTLPYAVMNSSCRPVHGCLLHSVVVLLKRDC